jgi:hypothetical protein
MTAPVPVAPEPLWTLPGRPAFCPACLDPMVLRVWRYGAATEWASCGACGWREERVPVLEVEYRGVPLDGTAAELRRAVDLLEEDTVPETYWRKVRAGQAERARLQVIQGGKQSGQRTGRKAGYRRA